MSTKQKQVIWRWLNAFHNRGYYNLKIEGEMHTTDTVEEVSGAFEAILKASHCTQQHRYQEAKRTLKYFNKKATA
jgi:hypothetical protein